MLSQKVSMGHKGRWLQRRGADLATSSLPLALTVQCTYLQIGSSRSSGGFRKLPSFTAEDVDPRGDLGPPSGSPISTSVRPFWKGLLDRRSPILPLCTGCCRADGRKFMSSWSIGHPNLHFFLSMGSAICDGFLPSQKYIVDATSN